MRARFDHRRLLLSALLALGALFLVPGMAHALTADYVQIAAATSQPVGEGAAEAGISQPAEPSVADPAAPDPTRQDEDDRDPILTHPVTELSGPDPLFDDQLFDDQEDVWDPLEGMNRVFFGFNQQLDRWVWSPVTNAYQWAVPEPGRRAVRRAFRNLGSAPIFVNDLLQGRFRDAGETLGRFLLNSTVGMAGLFDPGVEAGWEYHHSDFGQTLAMAGVGKGPYLVLPVFGPTTTRDGFGDVVDRAFEPLTYVFGFGLLGPSIQILIGAGNGVATREVHVQALEALEESSVDFYAALRSVYLQNREAEIWAHKNRVGRSAPNSLPMTGDGETVEAPASVEPGLAAAR